MRRLGFALLVLCGCARAPVVAERPGPPLKAEIRPGPVDPSAFSVAPLPDELRQGETACSATTPNGRLGTLATFADRTRRVRLYESDALDPGDPQGPGGYWIELDENGRTRRLYTGLRRGLPYALRANAKLPLVAGNRVQAEAVRVDGGCDPRPLLLSFDLAALERDQDGDGLTDLEEAVLLTDPRAADSDGDGIPDGADTNPRVKRSEASGALSELIADVVRSQNREGGLVILQLEQQVDFPSLDLKLLTLSEDAAKAYQARFGPKRVIPIAVRGCEGPEISIGQTCEIDYRQPWAQVTFRATRTAEGWSLEPEHGLVAR